MHSSEKLGGYDLSNIILGGMICLPLIEIGHSIGKTYSFFLAICCIMFANAILAVLSIVFCNLSYKLQKNPLEICAIFFHKKETSFFAFLFFFSSSLWFIIQLNSISAFFLEKLGLHSAWYFNGILGILFTFLLLRGIRSLRLLSRWAVPFLVLFLIYFAYAINTISIAEPITASQEDMPLLNFSAISISLSAALFAVIDLPTYSCLAKSKKGAMSSSIVCMGIFLSLIEFVGAFVAVKMPQYDLVSCFYLLDIPYKNVLIFAFFFLAAWTTNNLNLYAGSIGLHSLYPQFSEKKLILITGMVATACACIPWLHQMEYILILIDACMATLCGIVCMRAHVLKQQKYSLNALNKTINAWISFCGILIGIFSYLGILHISSSPILDSFLVVVILCLIFSAIDYINFILLHTYPKNQGPFLVCSLLHI